jgi:ABC-2 type transport system permease protein
MTTPNPGELGVVGLVARRELTLRLRSKAWRITVLVMVLIVVGLVIGVHLLRGTSTTTVGFTPQAAPLAAPLRASASALGSDIRTRTVPDQSSGQGDVAGGSLDVLVYPDGARLRVIVKTDLDPTLHNALTLLAQNLALDAQISRLGGDPAAVRAAVRATTVEVTALQPPSPRNAEQIALGAIAGVLIYVSLMMTGQGVAQGVVEEKSSRVVEVLLATVRPWQLMTGKVLGLGLVGLIQVLIIGGAGLAAGLSAGVLSISVSAAAGTIGWVIAWYLLGFAMYSVVFAGLGALVSRQEDIAGAVFPAMVPVIIGYVLGVSFVPTHPDSPVTETLSIIPLFAPTLMPMRLAMGGIPVWEPLLAVALVLVLIPVLMSLSARIYRNAVLYTGARVKLRQALRAA